jgi:hypothetical protein
MGPFKFLSGVHIFFVPEILEFEKRVQTFSFAPQGVSARPRR